MPAGTNYSVRCTSTRFRAPGTNRSGAGDVAQENLDPPVRFFLIIIERQSTRFRPDQNNSRRTPRRAIPSRLADDHAVTTVDDGLIIERKTHPTIKLDILIGVIPQYQILFFEILSIKLIQEALPLRGCAVFFVIIEHYKTFSCPIYKKTPSHLNDQMTKELRFMSICQLRN